MESGLIATAPTFQTSHKKYLWLNRIQAVAAGQINGQGELVYSLYQVNVSTNQIDPKASAKIPGVKS